MIADRLIGRMTSIFSGIAACVFAVSIALPSAAADSDLYIEYSGGVSYVRNQRLTGADPSGANLAGRAEALTGFNVGAAIGKRLYEHFRAEIQLTYRQNEVDGLSLQNEAEKASGHIGLLAIMANGYVDYDLGIGVIPYVGAGIGWGSVELDANNRAGALTASVEGQDSVFVWSLMVGGSYPINDVLDISLGYRYIATTEPEFNSGISNLGARRLDSEYDAHEGVFGLRFNF